MIPGFTFSDHIQSNEKSYYKIDCHDTEIVNLSVSMIKGFVTVYIHTAPNVSETHFLDHYDLDSFMDVHKFLTITSHYNIKGNNVFYFMIINKLTDDSTFYLTVYKNGFKSPIEPGVTKFLHLGPGEITEFYYTPKL